MSDQYIGEIRQVGFTYAPPGWLKCDGAMQAISLYDALFTLIGTTYGGDGVSTFALPDLRGRVPLHQGSGGGTTVVMGQQIGSESVTLTAPQVGSHTHALNTGPTGTASTPSPSTLLGDTGGEDGSAEPPSYGSAALTLAAMANQSISATGGSQSHENRQPFLALNFIIATEGIFPTQQ